MRREMLPWALGWAVVGWSCASGAAWAGYPDGPLFPEYYLSRSIQIRVTRDAETRPVGVTLAGHQASDEAARLACQIDSLKFLTIKPSPSALVTSAGLADLPRLQQLEALVVYGAAGNDGVLAAAAALPKLRGVSITPHVTDGGLAALARAQKLASLSLYRCPVTDAGVASLQHLPLEHLDLHGTQVTGVAAGWKFDKLRTLVLDRAPLDDAGVAALFKAEPLKVIEVLEIEGKVDEQKTDILLTYAQLPKLEQLFVRDTRVARAAAVADLVGLSPCKQVHLEGSMLGAKTGAHTIMQLMYPYKPRDLKDAEDFVDDWRANGAYLRFAAVATRGGGRLAAREVEFRTGKYPGWNLIALDFLKELGEGGFEHVTTVVFPPEPEAARRKEIYQDIAKERKAAKLPTPKVFFEDKKEEDPKIIASRR